MEDLDDQIIWWSTPTNKYSTYLNSKSPEFADCANKLKHPDFENAKNIQRSEMIVSHQENCKEVKHQLFKLMYIMSWNKKIKQHDFLINRSSLLNPKWNYFKW